MTLTPRHHAVLAAVEALQPYGYGVTLRDHIFQHTGRRPSFGALIVTLEQLEDAGLVTSQRGQGTAERSWLEKLHWSLKKENV